MRESRMWTLEDIRGMLTGLAGGSLGGAERSAAATVPAGLDPGVASAARDAGITEEQLRKLGSLMMKPNRMVEAARGEGVPRRKTALSESEDEEEAAEDTAGEDAAGAKPIEKAVLQLTKLMATMAKPSRKKGGLEGILERIDAGGTGGDGGPASSSGGRSKAAAYLKLKEALRSHPSWIYQSIEGQMEEDFSAVRSQPGSTSVVTTSRAWVEHRSRIGHFPSTIRAAWLLAGVHDSLKNQEFDQARARCCLGLAAIDQSAMDQGNWSLAQEFLLELPPPYGSFSNRPVDPSEHQSTRLVDDRFLEVMMWRLRDRDHFHESKKRLSANQTRIRPPPGGDGGQPRGEPKDPKKKPKPKPRPRQGGRASCGGGSIEERGAGESGAVRVPGARASTVHGRIWDTCFSVTLRLRTGLSTLLHKILQAGAFKMKAQKGNVWPMPLPYPEALCKRRRRTLARLQERLALNYLVLVLDWLAMGEKLVDVSCIGLGSPLNSKQWEVVRRLAPLVRQWVDHEEVDSAAMGRSAAKMETVEDAISALEEALI